MASRLLRCLGQRGRRAADYLADHRAARWAANTGLVAGGSAVAAGAVGTAFVYYFYRAGLEEVPYSERLRWMPPDAFTHSSWMPRSWRQATVTTEDVFVLVPSLRAQVREEVWGRRCDGSCRSSSRTIYLYPICFDLLQWGASGQQLEPVAPGKVKVTFVVGEEGQFSLAQPAVRDMVEAAACAAAEAVADQVKATGFGKHTQAQGWNVIISPSTHSSDIKAFCLKDRVIVISSADVYQTLNWSYKETGSFEEGAAALMWTMFHEMGHAVLRHTVRGDKACQRARRACGSWWERQPAPRWLPKPNLPSPICPPRLQFEKNATGHGILAVIGSISCRSPEDFLAIAAEVQQTQW